MRFPRRFAAMAVLASTIPAFAADPPPVPATRADLKRALEDSKKATPRLPLPPLTAEQEVQMRQPVDAARGRLGLVNNGRMRQFYLPREVAAGGFAREPDPAMTLGHPFQTRIFWIVSCANNCTYCMGHQEAKLSAAGLDEEAIASLDGDWSDFPADQRAAFTLARKLTFEPDRINDRDIIEARKHLTDAQVLEVLLVTGNFNAMNRWTGALRIPQEEHRVYLSPTSPKFKDAESRIAPLDPSRSKAGMACARSSQRGELESRAEVEKRLAAARTREPRLPLADESKARADLSGDWSSDPLPQWVRLLGAFSKAGPSRVAMHRAADEKGTLDATLKAQIAWIAARNDRAWYALGHARQRLLALGQTDDAIFALDGAGDGLHPGQKAAFSLARKLTTDPALIDDADIAELRKHFPDKQVAEIVFQVTEAAFFNRLTEAAGLRLER